MDSQRKTETEAKIRELRDTINALESQLAEKSHHDSDVKEQHELINQLDKYIDAVDTKATGLKSFWQVLKKELGAKS